MNIIVNVPRFEYPQPTEWYFNTFCFVFVSVISQAGKRCPQLNKEERGKIGENNAVKFSFITG